VLEGRFGFLQAFCGDRVDLAALTDGLGERWETPGIFFKPYPCNHFTHAGIDAALRLRAAGIDPARITALRLGVPEPVLRTIAEPIEEKRTPRSGYHGAFSGPYTVAVALLGGGGLGVFHDDFTDERARDPEVLALAGKVTVVADPECTEIFPTQFPAVLTAELDDGRTVTEKVLANRGGPENPLTAEELTAKFVGNAERSIDPAGARELAALAWELPAGGTPRAVTARLRELTAGH
jgi:2-methylcitrate dehydratase PrpD